MNEMHSNDQRTVKCSVGILTFNSARTLVRTLESVKDFTDIIISDGGSTDETLEIAKSYGCRIIDQLSKTNPGPEQRHPITDFSAEHNQMLAVASEDWYLRLDSDEYISRELHSEIAKVATSDEFDGYRLPMFLQSPDATVTYCLPSAIYQVRLIQRRKGEFKRPIHEHFVFSDTPKIKTLTGAWYVPISKPDFETYKWAVNYRLGLMLGEKLPLTFSKYIRFAWYKPFSNFFGILSRLVLSYLTMPWSVVPPGYYFRNRLYSQWILFKITHQLYFSKKRQ